MAGVNEAALAFKILGERLRRDAAGDLKRELDKAINAAARPITSEVRLALPGHMPSRYAAVLDEDLRLTITKAVVRDPGVRITATTRGVGGVKRRRIRRLEAGVLAHPLFGNRRHWFNQTDGVQEGFFSGPISDAQPQVRQAIVDAMADIADKATRKA